MDYETEDYDSHKDQDLRYNFLLLENLKDGEFDILLKKGDLFEFNNGIFTAPCNGFYRITSNSIARI